MQDPWVRVIMQNNEYRGWRTLATILSRVFTLTDRMPHSTVATYGRHRMGQTETNPGGVNYWYF